MNQIAALLPAANIVVDLDVASKAEFFARVGEVFEQSVGLPHAGVAASLAAREKLGSTGLGQGIAIPHGRIKGLKEAVGAFVRLKQPIPFDAPDGQPVSLIFVLLVPDRATDLHLQILSELAQMFSDRPFRERLAASATPAEVNQLIAEWQPHAASQHSPVV